MEYWFSSHMALDMICRALEFCNFTAVRSDATLLTNLTCYGKLQSVYNASAWLYTYGICLTCQPMLKPESPIQRMEDNLYDDYHKKLD